MSRNRRSKCIFIRLVQLINLLVPPVYLVSKTIHHFLASSYKARAVLVCSRWPSTTFWPLLHKKVNKFHEIVYDSFTLKDTTNYIKRKKTKSLLQVQKISRASSQFILQNWIKILQITIITLLIYCLFFIGIICREISKKYCQVNRSIDICWHSLSEARGSNTINLCTRYFSKWQQWVRQFPNDQAIPADDTYVIAYMLNLFQKKVVRKYRNFIFCYEIFSENHR